MYTWKKWSGHVTVGEVYVKQGRCVDVGTQHKQFKINFDDFILPMVLSR